LFRITWLKLLATPLGIEKIQVGAEGGLIRFGQHARIDPVSLVGLVEDQPESYRLDGPFKLRFTLASPTEEARLGNVEKLLVRLGATATESRAA
jgi:transcription-repair coupling factor (superfamily II helicase)